MVQTNNGLLSIRKVASDLLGASFILLVLIEIVLILNIGNIPNKIMNILLYTNSFVLLMSFVMIMMYLIKCKGLKNYIEINKFKNEVEKNLISIGMFRKINENVVKVPKIDINLEDRCIIVEIWDMKSLSEYNSYEEYAQMLLPLGYEVVTKYQSSKEKTLTINYQSSKLDARYTFASCEEFIHKVNNYPYSSLIIDKNHPLSLLDTPMIQIGGVTGSGKSYFAQTLIYQMLIKGYEVVICDYKRSYQSFEDLCDVCYSIEDIRKALNNAVEELKNRQSSMDKYLRINRNAKAIDYMPIRFIVIEEYLALVNSGIDKKILQEIEKNILTITTLGRALGIHLMLVMQVSSASDINSSIRANLSAKFILGNMDETIIITSFGRGVKQTEYYKVGEGMGSYGNGTFNFKAPTLSFKQEDIEEYLKNQIK